MTLSIHEVVCKDRERENNTTDPKRKLECLLAEKMNVKPYENDSNVVLFQNS